MSTTYAGDPDDFPDQLTLPDDGDDANAETINSPLRALFNRMSGVAETMAARLEWNGVTDLGRIHSVTGNNLNSICSPAFPSGTTDPFVKTVAVGGNATIISSYNGRPFGSETVGGGFTGRLYSVAQNALGCFAVGANEEIQTRIHNTSVWAHRNTGANGLSCVATSNHDGHSSAVAIGENGTIYRFFDSISVSTTPAPASEFIGDDLICVANEGGNSAVYMAVTRDGGIMRSVNDGANWFAVHTITGTGTVSVAVNALSYNHNIGWVCLYSDSAGGGMLGIATSSNGADWVNGTPANPGSASHIGDGSVAGIVATPSGVVWMSQNSSAAEASSVGVYWKLRGFDFKPGVDVLHRTHSLISELYRPGFLLYTPGHFWMLGGNDAGDGAIFTGSSF